MYFIRMDACQNLQKMQVAQNDFFIKTKHKIFTTSHPQQDYFITPRKVHRTQNDKSTQKHTNYFPEGPI